MAGKIEEGDKGMEREGERELCTYEIDLAVCIPTSYLEKEKRFIIYCTLYRKRLCIQKMIVSSCGSIKT